MKPVQVYVDDEELARLDAWSRERGMTKSQALRAAIRALTRPPDDDPLLSLSGMVHDRLPPDCSERFDRYLQETFVAEAPASYQKRRARPRTRPRR
ncbi:ribbon-helix-helix domain-containing protein [Candidatus Binatia bacterium]|nr:ribbon-helix-helix domain-containing protein [Candidatus Binatia bacterium]